jgi:2-polyprenyl-3-methyl-5-hydroxy-6-metoxy-1,4-benzoquinol methylase
MVAATREAVSCDLCGQDDPSLLVTKNGFRVVRCRGCELVFVSPRPKFAALKEIYDADTFFEHQVERAGDESWRPVAEERVQLIDKLHPTRGTLLDVGCSAGWFMGVAQDDGWKVVGFDVATASVAHARSRGFDARLATLDQHDLPPASFDVITMFDSIEHMPSPMRALRSAHRLLRDDGIVMITTPNVDGLLPKLTYRLLARPFGAWDHPGPPGHIYQFSGKTLASALERTGFETIYDKTEAMDLEHSVGELEDAIMDVIAGRARKKQAVAEDDSATAEVHEASEAKRATGKPRLIKRALRRTVRTAAWAVVGGVSAPAPLVGRGDSLVVIARKRTA